MQHDPDLLRLVEADLDEVIAAAERAQLIDPLRKLAHALLHLRVLVENCPQAAGEGPRCIAEYRIVIMLRPADRHITADLVEHPLQALFVQLAGIERQPRGDHATPDIDANRRRHDGLVRRNHRTDGGADAEMDIRHRRHVVMHERQAGDIAQLLARGVVDVVGP